MAHRARVWLMRGERSHISNSTTFIPKTYHKKENIPNAIFLPKKRKKKKKESILS